LCYTKNAASRKEAQQTTTGKESAVPMSVKPKPTLYRLSAQVWWGTAFTVAFVGAMAYTTHGVADPPKPAAVAGLSPSDLNTFTAQFEKDLFPLMAKNCLPCHGEKNASQFLLPKEPRAAFLRLLAEGHFDEDNQASVVHRMTTTDKMILMPPPSMGEMARAEVALFEKFAEAIAKKRATGTGPKPDEAFPAYLEMPFTGAKPQEGLDNTFITFRQLRGKIKTIFNDEWRRNDRDLFVENVHLFAGADFMLRFDESSKAAPTFLTGVDLMGRDVASRAYLAKTGPFANFPTNLPNPTTLKAPTAPMKQAVDQLYQRMLYRSATTQEQQQAFALIQRIYQRQKEVATTAPHDLRFSLTVTDTEGQSVSQDVTVRATNDTHAIRQEFIDQNKGQDDAKGREATQWLYDTFTFSPDDAGQKVRLTNEATYGNVSISAIVLRGPLPATTEKVVLVQDPGVQAEGAWRIRGDSDFTSYEDNNQNKGESHITFPVRVDKPGTYEVGVRWRRFRATTGRGRDRGAAQVAARRVLVEVVSRDTESFLAMPSAPELPPPGEAHFTIDQSVDNRPFADLKTAFRFGANDGVEIRNAGTQKLVTADAVRLLPPRRALDEIAKSVIIPAASAIGKKQWIPYNQERFNAYNTIGPELFQDTDEKGAKKENIKLLFKPETVKKEGFQSEKFYRVGIVYPGKADNETNVPIVVKAKASYPIIQVVHPFHAHVGAKVRLDASSTFNLQRSPLKFQWTQIGGPRVVLTNPTAPVLEFTAPEMTAEQAAWEGLCRALMAHPDFLFTRPRSLATVTDPKVRQRLQLVKIAQDLLSRPPTRDEMIALQKGKSLATFVDQWLQSAEFKDFYFHRVRLYLESHGSPEQDEPARLWTYITTNDRPFKEILTADYTVSTDWQKQNRPTYHGKTGVLTMKGFIEGKPGLPHFNYPAQVLEKFLGYVFEVPDSVLQVRDGITAAATTDPTSVCYTCHKVLTPLAYQRLHWDDLGNYRIHDETGLPMDNSDQGLVESYPYKGKGIEAFAEQAQNKERFVRTILQNHFVWYFGRELRYETDERQLYKRLWEVTTKNNYTVRPIIRAIVLSPEYLNGSIVPKSQPSKPTKPNRIAKLAQFHYRAGVKF
jgi:hypothetical protein